MKDREYKKIQTADGLNVVVSPMPYMTSVSLGVWIGVGGRYESKEKSGISHLIEHMLFKGTEKRSARVLKEAIEGIGGSLNGFTADEVTCYMVKVPYNYVDLGIEILSDMVLNAKMDEQDLAKEKLVVCEEIKMYRDQPQEYVFELLGGLMWPNDPLGRPLTGTIKTVQSFKRADLTGFRDDNYVPKNMSIVAAGKVDPDVVFRYASENFKRGGKKPAKFKTPEMKQKSARSKFHDGETSQSHIAMGFYADGREMKNRYALKLMSVILGGNMSSRLFEELREKYGLCYDIASTYKRHHDVGEFIVHAGVDNKKLLRSVVAVLDELKKLKDLGVTNDELLRAKEFMKGQFLLALESTSSRMMWFGDRLMVDDRIPDVSELLKLIDDVTAEDIKRVAENTFKSRMTNFAVVGKVSEKEKKNVKAELERL